MSPNGIVFVPEVITGRKQFLRTSQHMFARGIVFLSKVNFE
jgi:hypothetical protein